MTEECFDAAVLGGGVIGLASARELALRGLRVVLFERGRTGRRSSWAAAGMLAPRAEAGVLGAQAELARESAALYPAFVEELQRETGRDLDYRTSGLIEVKRGAGSKPAEPAALAGVFWIDAEDLYRRVPDLASGFAGALHYSQDPTIDPRRLLEALRSSVERAGVTILEGVLAVEIVREGGLVAGVRTEDGLVRARLAVNAAGAWAGRIAGGGLHPDALIPVRGQMVRVAAGGKHLLHGVQGPGCYVLPRANGEWVAGATVENAGFDDRVTAAGVAGILVALCDLFPCARDMTLLETWSGLRPGTPDGLPYIGQASGVAGLIVAAGHFRNGILLTPITARIVARLALGEPAGFDLSAFAPHRAARVE